jgi:hypothetical protein
MSRAQMMRRVARLEATCKKRPIQAPLSILTPEERVARIRLLTHRLMNARGISPSGDESLADAAVRAASTMKGFSPHLIPTLMRIFGDEQSTAGSDAVLRGA